MKDIKRLGFEPNAFREQNIVRIETIKNYIPGHF